MLNSPASSAPMPARQQDQTYAFSFSCSGLADDTLLVTAFTAEEGISALPKAEITLCSAKPDIDLAALLNSPASLTIHHKYSAELRHFSGIITQAERGGSGLGKTAYRLALVPPLCRLEYGSDCRIFQNKSVPDIVRAVLAEQGIDDVSWNIDPGKHTPREYCVQYCETHLAFIERLLAEEGIFYYFEHFPHGRARLILRDIAVCAADCPGMAELEYNALGPGNGSEIFCSGFRCREQLCAVSFTQRDHSFRNPPYDLEQRAAAADNGQTKGGFALYDYPGRYKRDAEGRRFTRYKLEAARAEAELASGLSNAALLTAGFGFALSGHADAGLNKKWRLLTIRHEGLQPQAWGEAETGELTAAALITAPALRGAASPAGNILSRSGNQAPGFAQAEGLRLNLLSAPNTGGADSSRAALYANAFTAMPADRPYRPPLLRKPRIDGPQTAEVTGPEGEEIYTDEYGRVKLRFPWDRHHPGNPEASSCWIRVCQGWSGPAYGQVALPRIGHEVIVDFLDGDPDQPIITGRAYHETNRPPYPLPEHKTKMVIRSQTHKGKGYNEISLEDQKNQEEIYLRAQRDRNEKVRRNASKAIAQNEAEAVGNNRLSAVVNNEERLVGGDLTIAVGPSQQKAVSAKGLLEGENFGGLADSLGDSSSAQKGTGTYSLTVENSAHVIVGRSATEIVEKDKLVQVNGDSRHEAKGDIVIEAGQSLTLKCGSSEITLSQDGTVRINSKTLHSNQADLAQFVSDLVKLN